MHLQGTPEAFSLWSLRSLSIIQTPGIRIYTSAAMPKLSPPSAILMASIRLLNARNGAPRYSRERVSYGGWITAQCQAALSN